MPPVSQCVDSDMCRMAKNPNHQSVPTMIPCEDALCLQLPCLRDQNPSLSSTLLSFYSELQGRHQLCPASSGCGLCSRVPGDLAES